MLHPFTYNHFDEKRLNMYSPTFQSCSIQALIEAMRSHFSAEPPLYSKPRPKLNSGSPGHVLDPSHSQNVPSASEYGHVHQLPGPPRLPPKPFNNSGIVSTTPSVIPTTTFSGSPSPPYPPTTRTPIRLEASVVPAYASSVQSAAGADPTPVNVSHCITELSHFIYALHYLSFFRVVLSAGVSGILGLSATCIHTIHANLECLFKTPFCYWIARSTVGKFSVSNILTISFSRFLKHSILFMSSVLLEKSETSN